MRLCSLNTYNYKTFRSFQTTEGSGKTQAYTGSRRALFPAAVVLVLITIGFFSVLNKHFFQIYFYDSYGYFMGFLCVFGALLVLLIRRKLIIGSNLLAYLLIIAGTMAYCFISALLTNGGYRYLGVVLNTMCVAAVVSTCEMKKSMVKVVFGLLCIATLYCALHAKGYYDRQFAEHSVNSNYLGFFALVAMSYGNLFLTYLRDRETKGIQIARLLLCLFSFYIIWECQSRGALLSWMFYVVAVYLVPYKMFESKKMALAMGAGIACMGVIFTYIYVHGLSFSAFRFMGKSTDSRFRLWSYFWEHVFQSGSGTLIGYGTHSGLEELFGYGLHNIYIGIWYDIGLIGLLLFMLFILWNIWKAYTYQKGPDLAQMYALIGFFTFMIQDYFAVTFTGPLVVWNYTMLGLLHMRKERMRE